MPRHYKIKQRIAELNSMWNIRPTPNSTCGVQHSLKEHLLVRLKHLVEHHQMPPSRLLRL